jgi:hypothetical protein
MRQFVQRLTYLGITGGRYDAHLARYLAGALSIVRSYGHGRRPGPDVLSHSIGDNSGYPSNGEFANDTGQQNLTHRQSLLDAAASGNANIVQNLEDPNNARLLERQGAGQLPVVQGPNIKIEPPVKEGTRMPSK